MLYIVSATEKAMVPPIYVVLFALAIALPYIVLYFLRSIGLSKLAKNNGAKGQKLAWVPFLWFYTACMVCGKVRFFGKSSKGLPVVFTLIFTLASLLPIVYEVVAYFPLVGYYLQGGTVSFGNPLTQYSQLYTTVYEVYGIYVEGAGALAFNNPYPSELYTALNALSYVVVVLEFAVIFVRVPVFFDLFRRYTPGLQFLYGMLSILTPAFPVIIFIIRNKQAVDYNEYLRQRYNAFYGNNNNNGFGGYGNGYNGGYGANGYDANANSGTNSSPRGKKTEDDDPFPEFKDK